jgi:hypothetical protein
MVRGAAVAGRIQRAVGVAAGVLATLQVGCHRARHQPASQGHHIISQEDLCREALPLHSSSPLTVEQARALVQAGTLEEVQADRFAPPPGGPPHLKPGRHDFWYGQRPVPRAVSVRGFLVIGARSGGSLRPAAGPPAWLEVDRAAEVIAVGRLPLGGIRDAARFHEATAAWTNREVVISGVLEAGWDKPYYEPSLVCVRSVCDGSECMPSGP